MQINNVSAINNSPSLTSSTQSSKDGDDTFKNVLSGFLDNANTTDSADKLSNIDLMTGNADNTHDTVIASEKADIALKLTVQIRNKVIDAYNEVMHMQV